MFNIILYILCVLGCTCGGYLIGKSVGRTKSISQSGGQSDSVAADTIRNLEATVDSAIRTNEAAGEVINKMEVLLSTLRRVNGNADGDSNSEGK